MLQGAFASFHVPNQSVLMLVLTHSTLSRFVSVLQGSFASLYVPIQSEIILMVLLLYSSLLRFNSQCYKVLFTVCTHLFNQYSQKTLRLVHYLPHSIRSSSQSERSIPVITHTIHSHLQTCNSADSSIIVSVCAAVQSLYTHIRKLYTT